MLEENTVIWFIYVHCSVMKTLLDSMCSGQFIGNITKCKSKLYQEMPIWNMFRSLLSRSPPHKIPTSLNGYSGMIDLE